MATNDLPSFSKIADYQPPQVTNGACRDGTPIGQFYTGKKRFLITWMIWYLLAHGFF